ncbi:MAG: hypothetical protein HBSIN02_15260 [Bacteroidia bacterium]|nr:MAG: hypothetical protein HBSIN02_15260 [Bacteroidia bacterium]
MRAIENAEDNREILERPMRVKRLVARNQAESQYQKNETMYPSIHKSTREQVVGLLKPGRSTPLEIFR